MCTLIDSFRWKYIKIIPKKYRGIMSHYPGHWCKIWRKTDLFQKWQEFGEFWPEHSRVSKTCTFISSYCAKHLMFDLKTDRGVIFHYTERFEEKPTCCLENKMKNMANFHQSTWKSQNWDFDLQRSYASWHWKMMQNLKRNWFVISKLTWEIWLILTRALESLKYFHFNGLFLNKIYIVWAK